MDVFEKVAEEIYEHSEKVYTRSPDENRLNRVKNTELADFINELKQKADSGKQFTRQDLIHFKILSDDFEQVLYGLAQTDYIEHNKHDVENIIDTFLLDKGMDEEQLTDRVSVVLIIAIQETINRQPRMDIAIPAICNNAESIGEICEYLRENLYILYFVENNPEEEMDIDLDKVEVTIGEKIK